MWGSRLLTPKGPNPRARHVCSFWCEVSVCPHTSCLSCHSPAWPSRAPGLSDRRVGSITETRLLGSAAATRVTHSFPSVGHMAEQSTRHPGGGFPRVRCAPREQSTSTLPAQDTFVALSGNLGQRVKGDKRKPTKTPVSYAHFTITNINLTLFVLYKSNKSNSTFIVLSFIAYLSFISVY